MGKKRIQIVALCIAIANSALEGNLPSVPWHKNGWKVAAVSYGLAGACTTALGFYIYTHYRQLNKEKNNNRLAFHLRFKSKEILKITKASAPYFLVSGAVLLATALFLYHKSHSSK